MPRYWIIAPYHSERRDIFDRVWSFDLKNGIISLGYAELEDTHAMSEEELRSAIEREYPERKAQVKTRIFNKFWNFYHVMQPGDRVIARRGTKTIAGVGSVAGPPYYCKDKIAEVVGQQGHAYPNHMPICWQEAPRDLRFPNIVFSIQSLEEVKEATFCDFVRQDDGNV